MQQSYSTNRLATVFLSVVLLFGAVVFLDAQSDLKLEQGDHVTIVGNALPERMNHHGYFESLLHSRFPEKNLVVRNIGYGGDVVEDGRNLRVQNYGSRDDWLGRLDTDVIIAMYGFNESFRGPDKVDEFREHMEEFVEHVTSEKYTGSSAPRLALVSPIAFEDLNDPDLPDGSKQNRNLKKYTKAIRSVAEKHEVPFVNLFSSTHEAYASYDRNWTFNGVHLTEYGYRKLAPLLDRGLFGDRPTSPGVNRKKLRAAINEKNEPWFDRYRVNDGYNVYGGRASLSYDPNNTSNREVYKREMEILEQMTANRDKKVWAVAQGKNHTVTDDNLPPNIKVETNAPGDGPDGKHTFLGAEEAIEKMDLHDNLDINVFASEEEFPELDNPLQTKFDPEGRLWVNTWEGYPNYQPPGEKKDELIYFEDTNDDGTADERTIFADQLNNPSGFHFWNGGVIVAQSPYILFLKDTTGDGKADFKRRMLSHISAADSHHTANSFVWDAGGALFFQEGVFHRSQIETPYGVVRDKNGTLWRFEPDSYRVHRYGTKNWANTHGHVINRWNQGFVFDATSAEPYHDTLFSGYIPFPKEHHEPPQLYNKRTRPLPAVELLSSTHFPEKMRGNLLVANVIGFQGVLQYEMTQNGASYQGHEVDPIVRSSDPNFRPIGFTVGPEGALYLLDWHNPIIGHMQHHIRDPSRDHEHGRIYRITYKGRQLSDDPAIDGEPISDLLDLLKHPENYVRLRTKLELDERDTQNVIEKTKAWINQLDPDAPDYEHHVLEGLWVHQWHNVVNGPLLKKVMTFEDHRARAAAVRVLSYWREEVDGAWELMNKAVNDTAPLVRLEAVRGLSWFRNARAAGVALKALNHEMDKYLEYTLNETIRGLESYWKEALKQGKPIVTDNDAGLAYLLDRIGNEDVRRKVLFNQPSSPAVNRAIMSRPEFSLKRRQKALHQLAAETDREPVEVLLESLMGDGQKSTVALVPLLKQLDKEELAGQVNRLEELARETSSPSVQEAAFIAIASVEGNVDRIKPIASRSVPDAMNFLRALDQLQDEQVRSSAYALVKSLALQPPEGTSPGGNKVFTVHYYGSDTPNAKISSFEERKPEVTFRAEEITTDLEPVRSGGDTFALKYHATMNVTESGTYKFYLTSDDGSRMYVSGSEIINNDGDHSPREKSGTVTLEKGQHEIVITQYDSGGGQALSLKWTPPGSDGKSTIPSAVFVTPVDTMQKRAIKTLASLPAPAGNRFTDLVEVIQKTDHVLFAALQARHVAQKLDTLPREQAATAVKRIGKQLKQLAAKRRSQKEVTNVITFAQELTRFVGEQGTSWNKQLEKLKVRTITIKTVPGEMRYDTESFTVTPGETIAILLENPDEIPHNLVITVPGAYELVGKASMEQKDGASHEYVPQGKKVQEKILRHTALLEAGESERLVFEVPNSPDDYPYVCTFPGHWRTMKGVMHVRSN